MTQEHNPSDNNVAPKADPSWDIGDYENDEPIYMELSADQFRMPLFIYRFFRRFRRGKFSAAEEWMAYYRGMYATAQPNPQLFEKLLARNGCWDIFSPAIPGSAQANEFCSDGVFFADVHFLLERWLSHVIERGLKFFETPPQSALSGKDGENPYLNDDAKLPDTLYTSHQLWPSNYSPIHYQQAMEQRADDINELRSAIAGARCLVILFLDKPDQWRWLVDRLHADNRTMISTIVYEAADTHQRELLVSAWVENGWISQSSASKLVAAISGRPTPQLPKAI